MAQRKCGSVLAVGFKRDVVTKIRSNVCTQNVAGPNPKACRFGWHPENITARNCLVRCQLLRDYNFFKRKISSKKRDYRFQMVLFRFMGTRIKAGLSKATKTNYNTIHKIHTKVYIPWCDENSNKSELKCHFCCILAFYMKNQKRKWALYP